MGAAARPRAVIGVVALVVLAGCSGGVPFLDGGGDGGTGNATTTTTAERPTGAEKPYATPLNGTAVLDRHASRLRAGRNFTYLESTSLATGEDGRDGVRRNRTVRVNLTSGAVLARSSGPEARRTVYRSPNGSVYVRVQRNDTTRYPDPRYYEQTVNRSGLIRPPGLGSLEGVNTSYAGSETVDRQTVHVYEAAGTRSVEPAAFGVRESATVTEFTLGVAVTDQGHLKRHRTEIEATRAGRSVSLSVSRAVARVGNTTVPRPGWLATARAARANASAPRIHTVTVTDDAVAATVTAAVPVGTGDSVALAPARDDRYFTDPVEAARAGPVVRLSLPDGTRRAETTLVLAYREARVPEGEEDALTVRRFSPEYADSQPTVGTVTVDAARNQVRVRGVQHETTAVVLVHEPTFVHERKAQAAES